MGISTGVVLHEKILNAKKNYKKIQMLQMMGAMIEYYKV